jgi:DNA-binding NarL/FixJ family response regulator
MPMIELMVLDRQRKSVSAYERIVAAFPGSRLAAYSSARKALAARAVEAPDVLMIDADIALVDPIAFARRFKVGTQPEPTIVLIGFDRRGNSENNRLRGIDIFIPKPVNTELFVALLRRAVTYRHAQADVVEAVPA